jgi:hypothetical protein
MPRAIPCQSSSAYIRPVERPVVFANKRRHLFKIVELPRLLSGEPAGERQHGASGLCAAIESHAVNVTVT